MGWARMLLLGDIGQQFDIHDTRDELERVRRSAGQGAAKDFEQDEQLRQLADRNEQLTLCLVTLLRLLIAKGVIATTEVQELLAVLDPPADPATGDDEAEPSNEDLIALAEAARRLQGR